MRNPLRFLLAIPTLLLAPSASYAIDMEYYVWGGHDVVVNAFTKLSLIFGDNGYKTLFFSVVVMAIFFGGVTVYYRFLTGGKGSFAAWCVPLTVGVALYMGLVVPKATLNIYDPVYNKFQAVGGIPQGVVLMAGVLNTVERGLVEIVSTSGDPLGYQAEAGGMGFLGLYRMSVRPPSASDSYLDTSVTQYINDCVSFELDRPGTDLTVDELRRTTTDFRTSFAKAASPSIFTVYYDSSNPQGVSTSCSDAWTSISTKLNQPDCFTQAVTAVCSQMGFDVLNAASFSSCKNSIQNVLTGLTLSGGTLDDYMRQRYLSNWLDTAYRSGNTSGIANYQFLLAASGTMKAVNEWFPILKAVMTAVAVGLIPFIVLFIPTGLFSKAVGLVAGFFIWLTAWGVTDAILHQFAMDYANKVYAQVRQANLGMDFFAYMGDDTTKILGLFGTLRSAGLMLATMITGAFVKFGGYAFTQMASSIAGQIQSSGVGAAIKTEDPAGRGQAIESNAMAMPAQDFANGHSFGHRQLGALNQKSSGFGAGMAMASPGTAETFGFEGQRVSMGTTKAFMNSGDAMHSAELGTSMMKAPTGTVKAATGQEWVRNDTPDRNLTTLKSGLQSLTISGGQLTDASGMHTGINFTDGIRKGYGETIANVQSDALKYDTMTGRNLSQALSNSSGTSSIEGIMRKYGVSTSTTHDISNSMKNITSQIAENATSIRDEKGNVIDKSAFAQVVAGAQASAGVDVPLVFQGKVYVDGQAGYRMAVNTKEGHTSTYTVGVKDTNGVDREIGEVWRNTTQKMRSTDLSANDQRAVQEMLQVTNTLNTTTQAGEAWSKVNSLQHQESKEISQAATAQQNYETAFVQWYGDKKFGEQAPAERYVNAASALNAMANNAEKSHLQDLFKDFVAEKSVADGKPAEGNVWGVGIIPVAAPNPAPVNLDNVPGMITQANNEINQTKAGIPEPHRVPSYIRGKIAGADVTTRLDKPVDNPNGIETTQKNVETALERQPTDPFGYFVGGSPTAKDTAQGKVPTDNPRDWTEVVTSGVEGYMAYGSNADKPFAAHYERQPMDSQGTADVEPHLPIVTSGKAEGNESAPKGGLVDTGLPENELREIKRELGISGSDFSNPNNTEIPQNTSRTSGSKNAHSPANNYVPDDMKISNTEESVVHNEREGAHKGNTGSSIVTK